MLGWLGSASCSGTGPHRCGRSGVAGRLTTSSTNHELVEYSDLYSKTKSERL
jgi:hypothetical protein